MESLEEIRPAKEAPGEGWLGCDKTLWLYLLLVRRLRVESGICEVGGAVRHCAGMACKGGRKR